MKPKFGEPIGLKDKRGNRFKLGDYVKHQLPYKDSLVIKGRIIYGYYSAGRDEWSTQFKTLGFFIEYSDKSGTTGVSPDWEVITEKEYFREE